MEKFVSAIQNMFRIPELRKRILFTLGLLAIYRLGAHVTAPGINEEKLELLWGEVSGTLLGVLDLFSGGNFRTISVFALGVTPYITASIIMQLMTVLYPPIKKIQEEGEVGRQRINQYTRYLTVILCSVQTFFVATWLSRNGIIESDGTAGWAATIMIVVTLTTGTVFVMWLGEQITERGVGNGISLLIFAGIVIGLPSAVMQIVDKLSGGADLTASISILFLVAALIALIFLIVYMESARRNIAISYASRRVGNQTFSGQETSLPLKINMGGVIPVIFASSVLAMPQTVLTAFPPEAGSEGSTWGKIYSFFQQFQGGDPYYEVVFISLIVLFTFFYITIIFNTDDVADNLRKHGGFVPGIRPGSPTAEYLNTILTRLTTVGAIYLAFVAFAPQVMLVGFKVARLPFIGETLDNFLTATPGLSWIPTGLGYQFFFGGTSLLILVGVAMDTVSQIEAQLVMRNYEGFLGAGSRLRGRRN
jgi:preprotein translocase subunit SecY